MAIILKMDGRTVLLSLYHTQRCGQDSIVQQIDFKSFISYGVVQQEKNKKQEKESG